jgi:dimeric dUTPase (all-alpha-NTP-PPase superfamily)
MNQADARAMVQTMARMQDAHNCQVHPQWRVRGYPYYRAVWVECAELLDHFGWKWWKHQQPDLEQVKLELVDIWHFGLSEILRAESASELLSDRLADEVAKALMAVAADAPGDAERFRLAVEDLAKQTLSDRCFALEPFVAALRALPLALPELFHLYVGKNVLNHFRQDHGYQTGTYRKVWRGQEDNEHLMEILTALDCPPDAIPERLFAELKRRYPA